MHPDLSPHLHNEECSKLIRDLQECHEHNKFYKFLGACNSAESKLLKCLKMERLERRRKNIINAKIMNEKVRREYKSI